MDRRRFFKNSVGAVATFGALTGGLAGRPGSLGVASLSAAEPPPPSRGTAQAALRRAVTFFREKVSVEGGYLWRYSDDLGKREGEKAATTTQAWVQPPGTPTVGSALLAAYQTCGEPICYEAARDAATALARGQLVSGGWDYKIEFDAKRRAAYAYRLDRADGAADGGASRTGAAALAADSKTQNVTTFDDNTSQAAFVFLIRMERAMAARNDASSRADQAVIRDAVDYARDRFLAAQYPNGAWPQRYSAPPDPARFPVVKADYPAEWSRTFPQAKYYDYYTFNDHSIDDMIAAMFLAARTYDDRRCREAAVKAGDFMLLAQMPDPQPAWAQQYDARMHPSWARKFEPPAVTGGESQQILRSLMTVYRETGDPKYLAPIPRAIAYLRASRLPNGRLARFYELKTNRPLYFTKQYELTYDDGDLPTHYGFTVDSKLDSLEAEYTKLRSTSRESLDAERKRQASVVRGKPDLSPALIAAADDAIAALDARGAWATDGRLRYHGPDDAVRRVIETTTFVKRLEVLARYVAALDLAAR